MKVYNFSELKESRLIFERKAPPFAIIFTLLTLCLLVSIITIAGFSNKTYIVKANALATYNNKSNIMTLVNGKIDKVNYKEGDKIKQGDILFELNNEEINSQIIQ